MPIIVCYMHVKCRSQRKLGRVKEFINHDFNIQYSNVRAFKSKPIPARQSRTKVSFVEKYIEKKVNIFL